MAENSGAPTPSTSVVIVNWRQPALTERAVESVRGQGAEIVIVENEAAPEAAEFWSARVPEAVVVVNPGNEGFAGGVTSGIARASGRVIVLLNNDAVAEPGFLAAGLARLAAEPPSVAAVAAHVVLEGRYRPATSGDRIGTGTLVGIGGERWVRSPEGDATGVELTNSTGVVLTRSGNCYDRDWLRPTAAEPAHPSSPRLFAFTGGAVFLRREVLDELGGFDTRFFMYYEDVDLSWRMRLAGYDIVYEPLARVVHRHAGSSDHDSPLVRSYSIRNRSLTMLKNAPARAVLAVLARTVARAAADAVHGIRHHGRGPESGALLSRAGWRLFFGSVLRLTPALLRERRRSSAADRRRVFADFAR